MNFLPILIAKKLYLKDKKNYTIFFVTILSRIGIFISVFALIMSFSALNGFQKLLNNTVLSTLPHAIIQLTEKSYINWKDMIIKLKMFPEVSYSEPYIIKNGLLIVKNKIKTIEMKSFRHIKYLKKNLLYLDKKNIFLTKKNINEIIISSYLAKYLSIKIGDSIDLIFFNEDNNHISSYFKHFSFKISNIFESNGILDTNLVYIPFSFFKNFLNINDNINSIELHISDPLHADQIILNILKKMHTPLLTYTWMNHYEFIYHNIKKIKTIVYLILILLVIISCFSIASISLMTISKKTQEIAILRSIGASNILIHLIFLCYGLRSILIGSVIGLFTGIIIIINYKNIRFFLENRFKDNILFDNFYYHNFFLLKIDLLDIMTIFISIIGIGIITNWYPAYCASKINPSSILKEY
ncbi:FtsX-like permease family protein [Buchnera aphidicola (Macrosiphoniella sanborni)]|uniref:FtsX-like permease family protein n=1 Tax=Buchnera aphidicola (Macrosiphoniella sanborni) TaxID=1241865 RepID=A0A4D6YHK4_9GAMM|nr:FtsX-like permease family protein [Buchnera aphidicola]QCI23835.1 FtsX-like permease family protein [Buchnera aphidicola (Macrosiphoniella sanborni)]